MKLALTVNCWSDEDLMLARQFGVTDVLAAPVAPDGMPWDTRLLAAIRNRAEKAGFGFAGLADLPPLFGAGNYLEMAMRGDAGRDDAIQSICAFITVAGAAGIPLIGYEWSPALPVTANRPARSPEGRGRALVGKYARPAPANPDASQAMWQHIAYFMQRVIPVAEKAGVKLAGRPNYPPELSTSGEPNGSPRMLDSADALQRLIDSAPSPCNGLDFRQGVVAQMPGVDLIQTIHRFAQQKKIFLVEIGNLQVMPAYVVEAFLDERTPQAQDEARAGATMLRALQAYQAAGYDGTIRPAPPPGLVEDTAWGHKGQSFNVGYLRALLQVVERTR